jgi:hypothetical protein
MRHLFNSRKRIAFAAAGAAVLLGGVTAVAYWTTTGAGTGSGTAGTDTAMVIHHTVVYSNVGSDNAFVPGSSATVTFTVDNPSSGHEYLDTIHLSSVTSNKLGCNSASQPTWFTMPDVSVALDYAPGSGQAVAPTGTITFNNDALVDQSACKSAALAFHYTSN